MLLIKILDDHQTGTLCYELTAVVTLHLGAVVIRNIHVITENTLTRKKSDVYFLESILDST